MHPHPSHKPHDVLDKSPTMHHFATEMCTPRVHISVTKWCVVGYGTGAFGDLGNMSEVLEPPLLFLRNFPVLNHSWHWSHHSLDGCRATHCEVSWLCRPTQWLQMPLSYDSGKGISSIAAVKALEPMLRSWGTGCANVYHHHSLGKLKQILKKVKYCNTYKPILCIHCIAGSRYRVMKYNTTLYIWSAAMAKWERRSYFELNTLASFGVLMRTCIFNGIADMWGRETVRSV